MNTPDTTPTPVNFADRQRQMDTDPTLDQCRQTGRTHRAYGWAPTPPIGARTAAQRAAYTEGFTGGAV